MAGLCFYFEAADIDVWSGKDLDAWNYAAKAAGDIDKVIVINRTDQTLKSPDSDMDFEVLREAPDLPGAIYCAGPGELADGWTSVWDYDHAADWYCFGPASGWQERRSPQLHVPMAGGALHSVHAATAIMLHRFHVRGAQ